MEIQMRHVTLMDGLDVFSELNGTIAAKVYMMLKKISPCGTPSQVPDVIDKHL